MDVRTAPLHATSAADVVAAHLRGRIHAGELSPGDQLPAERDLADQLGVGRQTLREALKTLTVQGYVLSRRGSGGGTFVAALTEARALWLERMRQDTRVIGDIIDLRVAVESHAAALAARRRTDRHLRAMHDSIVGLDGPDGRDRFRAFDSAFHRAITDAAASSRLTAAVHHTRGELFLEPDRIGFTEMVAVTRDAHQAILDPIADRDEAAAATAMTAHIEQTRLEMAALLQGAL